jgi:branched-chain amino acid transport system permease protein
MAIFSTFLTWMFWERFGLPPWVALFASMALSFVLGAIIERLLIRPVGNANKNPLSVVIVTIGMFLAINALAQYIWGSDPKQPPQLFPSGSVRVLGADVSYQTLGTLAVLGVLAALLYLLFQKTKVGLAMRGVASNSESTALAGVPVGRMLMLGWGLAAAIGAVAGLLTATGGSTAGFDSSLMQVVLIYAFAAATLGGFDSPVGAVVGGLTVGVVAELSADYIPAIGEQLRLLPGFILIILVLVVRPQGLFGKAQVRRV